MQKLFSEILSTNRKFTIKILSYLGEFWKYENTVFCVNTLPSSPIPPPIIYQIYGGVTSLQSMTDNGQPLLVSQDPTQTRKYKMQQQIILTLLYQYQPQNIDPILP